MKQKDVMTIGDAMITFNPVSKGPMRYSQSFERKVGGAELNFAIGCARLGLQTGWISRLGADEFGRHILNFVRGEGIDVSEVKLVNGYPTSLNFKEILEDGSGSTYYYRYQSPTTVITKDAINEDYIKASKFLHITGVFAAIDKKNPGILKHAVALAKKHDVKVSLDPNLRLKLWTLEEAKETLIQLLPFVDVVLCGEEEAELLFGEKYVEEYIHIFKEYGIRDIVIKQGEKGATAFRAEEGKILYGRPIKAKIVVDTVGAGDGFNAGYIYSLLNGKTLEESLKIANTIGSMVVAVSGDNEGLPYLEDVAIALGEKKKIER
ncbi:sugar kinase [Evansella cellulosilytica]|uniref:Cyclic nucleotide-binding protein n=1 Tax=Evansella cellulosilytica (strain ATCC 21833 / DSM 2522 / FERM P-1141 / JCM 9156 / N-4) TaxID=649639 RepID=E6TTW0_EVAC2|nr:sugar kinase [Evansella cellulosilytica]ADU31991.1 cyclic nucleotide-binding protein [Evansella cellulosilytica DSM 2522]